ncbi:hypothetical protein ACFQY4_16805 [Catellatospora bangladeshensis]|uniref:hypothetical protein n=1 Tax=Catellatospora bangladeshensis TaxID=310355 RepID=UPI00361DD643
MYACPASGLRAAASRCAVGSSRACPASTTRATAAPCAPNGSAGDTSATTSTQLAWVYPAPGTILAVISASAATSGSGSGGTISTCHNRPGQRFTSTRSGAVYTTSHGGRGDGMRTSPPAAAERAWSGADSSIHR